MKGGTIVQYVMIEDVHDYSSSRVGIISVLSNKTIMQTNYDSGVATSPCSSQDNPLVVRGMSYALTKRVGECTPEEREYKLEYGRWTKERFMARHGYEAFSNYCSEYGKKYYEKHREEHIERVKQNRRRRVVRPSTHAVVDPTPQELL